MNSGPSGPELSEVHARRTLLGHLRVLWSYRQLAFRLVQRDIRVRYKQSVLGVAWAVLQPLALMLIFTLIFSRFLRVGSEGKSYPLFSYVGLLPWTFFASSVSTSVPNIVGNLNLVTKIYFPREILPLAAVLTCMVDFAVASAVLVGMMVWYHSPITICILAIPSLVVIQTAFAMSIGLFGSAVNVYFRDIRFVLPLFVQLWMYASPVAYPLDMVPERYRPWYMLNPMAGIIDGYRQVVLHGRLPDLSYVGLAAAICGLLLVGSYWFFKRVEMTFADII
jgi:lipopolysaccharide transport system permease protein